jgi:hypothetical protein
VSAEPAVDSLNLESPDAWEKLDDRVQQRL